MSEKPVFSTKPIAPQADREGGHKNLSQRLNDGPIKMRLETKGRGGKAVTVLFNLPLTPEQAAQLGKDLQQKLGVGGTFKDGCLELRGDMRDKIEKIFVAQGIPFKRAGG